MSHTSTLHFFGGAGSVTGSNFLLESEGFKVLVDCGLFQGSAYAEEVNWKPFPFDPASIPLLVVTHAHIDHVGRIPRLVKQGFRGKILSTEATKAIAGPLLQDSMQLLARDALHSGKEPLYEQSDIDDAFGLWEGISYHEKRQLDAGFELELLDAGHILGSAMARFSRGGKTIVFTGDLGSDLLLLPPRDSIVGTDYLLMESVYGDRVHKNAEPIARRQELGRVIKETVNKGGVTLIPAFSTERTQDLLIELGALRKEGILEEDIPVYLDSPLAQKMTDVFLSHPGYFKADVAARIKSGENIFSFPNMHMIDSAEASHHMMRTSGPKVIIAGSGMSNGGRVLSHEKDILPEKTATLLIVGYQAAGSLGRRLLEGVRSVEIMGERVPVRARIASNLGYSAHLDGPHLLEFAQETKETLKQVFVVMGEPASSGFLVQRLRDHLGISATAPEAGESATLEL